MSFIAVQKKDARGAARPRVRLHFRDYTLAQQPHGASMSLDPKGSTKCYACHGSGVRKLIPRRTSFLEARPVRGEAGFRDTSAPPGFAAQRLASLNERLTSYGLPDWNGLVAEGGLGPPLGEAQGCTSCHNGRIRAPLTVMTSDRQIAERVQYELAMPPDAHLVSLLERSETKDPPLTAAEQAQLDAAFDGHGRLLQSLVTARPATLSRWLRRTRCQ
jgi:hypothetical protein